MLTLMTKENRPFKLDNEEFLHAHARTHCAYIRMYVLVHIYVSNPTPPPHTQTHTQHKTHKQIKLTIRQTKERNYLIHNKREKKKK